MESESFSYRPLLECLSAIAIGVIIVIALILTVAYAGEIDRALNELATHFLQ